MNKTMRSIIPVVLLLCLHPAAWGWQSRGMVALNASVYVSTSPLQNIMLIEGKHLLNCQVRDYAFGASARGCFNDVTFSGGGPDWVVPRENGTAILGLMEAYDTTQNEEFREAALLAAEYLKNRQEADGGWCNRYNEMTRTWDPSHPEYKNKTPSEAGSAIMAFYKIMSLGWEDSRHQYYANGINAAIYIMSCVDNKPGISNGLAGSGKEYQFSTGGSDDLGPYGWGSWSWVSDNCYAYLGLVCMREWAAMRGDIAFAGKCDNYAQGILNGINTYLKNPSNPAWYRVVDGNGNLVSESTKIDALCYYPQKLDLPVPGYGSESIARWMKDNLQARTGSVSTGEGAFLWGSAGEPSQSDRRSPGFSMEAWLALADIPGAISQQSRDLAKTWWESNENSGGGGSLWNKIDGGFIDWYDPDGTPNGSAAPSWQRFIDTSAYCIFAYRGGYDFRMGITPDMPRPVIAHASLQRISPMATVVVATGTAHDVTGLSRIDAYYYKDNDTSISTATFNFHGYPSSSGFSCAMNVTLSGARYFYYRLVVFDQRGFSACWPSNDGNFCRVDVDASCVATVGIDGGTISMSNENPNDGRTALEIPKGALDSGTQITITELNPADRSALPQNALAIGGQSGPVAVYQFGPDGLVFRSDVKMTLLYRDVNHDGIVDGTNYPVDTLRIMWWDGIEWRLMGGTVDPQTNTVTCTIRHFSIYAIFPAAAIVNNDVRPRERIITPALADRINDYATFGGLDDTDSVNIYDVTGRRVRQLHGNSIWDGRDDDNALVESGLYIYQIKHAGKTISGTIVVAK